MKPTVNLTKIILPMSDSSQWNFRTVSHTQNVHYSSIEKN